MQAAPKLFQFSSLMVVFGGLALFGDEDLEQAGYSYAIFDLQPVLKSSASCANPERSEASDSLPVSLYVSPQ